MNRLNNSTISTAANNISIPSYQRSAIKPGIVHLGIGAFHRAHQAYYTNKVLNQFGGDWGIIGCSLRSSCVRDQLEPQDCYYTLVERSSNYEKISIIGSVVKVIVGPDEPSAIINVIHQSSIEIVSLTITEKGYCHDVITWNLNKDHPDIEHDLNNIDKPRSAIGFIVAGLKARFETHGKGLTLLSCDNLQSNGIVLCNVVIQFSKIISPELSDWIKENVSFPCTMVDRIVPATTELDREKLEKKLGLRDEGLVVSEVFSQWIIEDSFINGRPQWENVGAQFVDDVAPYERLKLHCLNGSHSLLAYSGFLSGYTFVSDVTKNDAFVNLIKKYINSEIRNLINIPDGVILEQYTESIIERFSNESLNHKLQQIASDGSQKIPVRWLTILRKGLATGNNYEILSLGIASWIRYMMGFDENGQSIDIQDSMHDQVIRELKYCGDSPDLLVMAALRIEEIFGLDLIENKYFIQDVAGWLSKFLNFGVRATIEYNFSTLNEIAK